MTHAVSVSPESSDNALLRAVAANDDLALAHFYARHGGAALSHARAVLTDEHLAEEAVQEAFLDLWRTAPAFDGNRSSAAGWLHTLVHRRAVDIVRSRQRRPVSHFDETTCRLEASGTEDGLYSALGAHVIRLLRELSPPQRRSILLAYWGGYTMAEIAALDGVPIGTVKTRCRAALQRLRALMGSGGDDICSSPSKTTAALGTKAS